MIDLRAELDSRIDYWRDLYGSVVLCPSPSFISNMKTSGQKMQLFRWFVDLQRQRNRLQDEMTEHFVGNSENARKSFGKAAKAMRALPLAKVLGRSYSGRPYASEILTSRTSESW